MGKKERNNPFILDLMCRNEIKCPTCGIRLVFDIKDMMYVKSEYVFQCPICKRPLDIHFV